MARILPLSLTDRSLRVMSWLVLLANAGITVTGALVRLTGSGLGCPTWPLCTEASLVPTPEMGIHGAIEFGNRLLTFVLLAVTLLALVALARFRRERPDMWRMILVLTAGIPLQAIIGGLSVLFALNPYVVGLHFVLSASMVSLATILVLRIRDGVAIVRLRDLTPLSRLIAALTSVVLLIGILTTGSGPHAGDIAAARNGLNPELLQHLHAWPAYATVGLIIIALGSSTRRVWWLSVLAGFGVQICLGIWQSRTGLPVPLVALHIAAAMTVIGLTTAAIYRNTTSGSIATARKSAVK